VFGYAPLGLRIRPPRCGIRSAPGAPDSPAQVRDSVCARGSGFGISVALEPDARGVPLPARGGFELNPSFVSNTRDARV